MHITGREKTLAASLLQEVRLAAPAVTNGEEDESGTDVLSNTYSTEAKSDIRAQDVAAYASGFIRKGEPQQLIDMISAAMNEPPEGDSKRLM
jgi:hypothetical protein